MMLSAKGLWSPGLPSETTSLRPAVISQREAIRSSGYVVHSLEAALWSVARSHDFRDAVRFAANLGEDADTTAAIAGQLAGAMSGARGLPAEWREHLAWHDRIEALARDLFRQSVAG